MKNLLAIFFACISLPTLGQLPIGQASNPSGIKELKYDSLENEMQHEKYKEYLGQELYCLPAPYDWQTIGNWAYASKLNGHKIPFNPVGQYFDVVFISDTAIPLSELNAPVQTWFKLKENDNGRIVYYSYGGGNFWHFLVVGYCMKMIEMYKGHYWYAQNDTVMKHNKWKCIDVIIDTSGRDVRYIPSFAIKLLFERDAKRYYTRIRKFFSETDATYYGDNFNIILDSKVAIGWTKELVRTSLGNPGSINTSIYQDNCTEQWIYRRDGATTYYYFDNGRLAAIQHQQ